MLRDYAFQTDYSKGRDDIARDFYRPCMASAIRYDRVTGYFASTVFLMAWQELEQLVDRGGHIRIICSPYLSEPDVAAIQRGTADSRQRIVFKSVGQDVADLFRRPPSVVAASQVLASLVQQGVVEFRIAVPFERPDGMSHRLFHDKVGLFVDAADDAVGFRGSMNETLAGLSPDGNIESVDVFTSWSEDRDRERVENAGTWFSQIWQNQAAGIQVFRFQDAPRELLLSKSAGEHWREVLREVAEDLVQGIGEREPERRDYASTKVQLRKNQIDGLTAWKAAGQHGILAHATGSGKTITALCAVRESTEQGRPAIIIVPSISLLEQWESEIRKMLPDWRVLVCGGGKEQWRGSGLLRSWTADGMVRSVVLCTQDTATTDEFRQGLSQGKHLMLVADEVHNLGCSTGRRVFGIESGARLGLSATPRRYGDEEGTNAILDYFGPVLDSPFSIQDAIAAGVLVPYWYRIWPVSLLQEEQEQWDAKTKELGRIIAMCDGDLNKARREVPRCNVLLFARARIIKNAARKMDVLRQVIQSCYHSTDRWLVYFEDTEQLEAGKAVLESLGVETLTYVAAMKGDRDATLRMFQVRGGVLLSIRCLDDGVDIPNAEYALILASSRNPREFIQRRGRLLRRFPGKYSAWIHDAVVVPAAASTGERSSYLLGELARALILARGAENSASTVADIGSVAIDSGIDMATLADTGEEDDIG